MLSVSAISFGFSIPTKNGEITIEIGKRCIQKIQDDYTIISYDFTEGAKIELSEDFYLSIAFSEELMKIKLNTKYDWQFEKEMKNFSVFDFVHTLESCGIALRVHLSISRYKIAQNTSYMSYLFGRIFFFCFLKVFPDFFKLFSAYISRMCFPHFFSPLFLYYTFFKM